MLVKRFTGRTVPEALKKVRSDLGPDAVIVQTHTIRRKGPLRWLGADCVEIVAGTGFSLVSPYAERRIRSEPAPLRRSGPGFSGPGAVPAAPKSPYPVVPAAGSPARESAPASSRSLPGPALHRAPEGGSGAGSAPSAIVEAELRDIKRMLSEVQDRVAHDRLADCPPELFQEYLGLVQNAVSDELARRLVGDLRARLKPEELRDARVRRGAVRATLQGMVPVAGPIRLREGRCTRVMFIGPTGVGKTTTIAKLAAQHRFVHKKGVAMITNDTYRLAATEQLRKFADIMGVPLRVVPAGEDVGPALRELDDFDLVLIDTAGRSQRDAGRMSELQALIESARPDEVHLVVSLTTHPDNLMEIIRRFSACRVDALVLTKLDEAARFGLILEVLGKVEKSLSYVTTGQSVPNDIEVADSDRICGLIVGDPVHA